MELDVNRIDGFGLRRGGERECEDRGRGLLEDVVRVDRRRYGDLVRKRGIFPWRSSGDRTLVWDESGRLDVLVWERRGLRG